MSKHLFASDNASGIHPRILEAIQHANQGHALAYGYDDFTKRAEILFKDLFGNKAEVFFVFSGTASNVLALESCMRPYEAVICSDVAHIHTDEAGAPERFLQSKLIPLASQHGKINVEQIPAILNGRGVEHHVQPKVISLTQSTEYGTIYTFDEIRSFADFAHGEGLYLHIDGARLANACAATGLSPSAMICNTGVDVLSFGGTKNGMAMGEAIVFLNPDLANAFRFRRKNAMQLASKMRYISAQFIAYFEEDLWLSTADHANRMAKKLATVLAAFPEIQITRPVEVNAVFAIFPSGISEKLQERFSFYTWQEETREVRLMCSWDTRESDIDAFKDALCIYFHR